MDEYIIRNSNLTGYDKFGRATPKLRPKAKALKDWIKWMTSDYPKGTQGGKGFVVIDGNLYRHYDYSPNGIKMTVAYHEKDIEYKWAEYFKPVLYTEDIRNMLLDRFDIKHKPAWMQESILRGLDEAHHSR